MASLWTKRVPDTDRAVNLGYEAGRPQLAQRGIQESENQARNQNYRGTFYRPENYQDPWGINFGQASTILQGGFSGQGDDITTNQDLISKALQERLGGLQNNQAERKRALATDLERSFANQAAMLRRGAAATGSANSMGFGRSVGDLANQAQQNQARAMLDLEGQGTQELGQLSGVGSQLFTQELANRQQALEQAEALSNLYMQHAQKELGGMQVEQQRSADQTAARKAAQASLINSMGQMAVMGASGGFGGNPLFGQSDLQKAMTLRLQQGGL